MKHQTYEPRTAYEARQIDASTSKIGYCKFSFRDAERYVGIIRRDLARRRESVVLGPTLCLGVRNGREVDCFRIARDGSWWWRGLVRRLERREKGFRSRLPVIERFGRSRHDVIRPDSVIGVELNPIGARRDVWVGSYDALPAQWGGAFHVVFTNAFDHAYEPESTIACWKRVIRSGGYFILDSPVGQDSAPLDPVGDVTLDDVTRLLGGELIYYAARGSEWTYSTFIVRLP